MVALRFKNIILIFTLVILSSTWGGHSYAQTADSVAVVAPVGDSTVIESVVEDLEPADSVEVADSLAETDSVEVEVAVAAEVVDEAIVTDDTAEASNYIKELEGDSTYMALIAVEAKYVLDNDSLNRAVTESRNLFLSGGDQAVEAQSKIIILEQSLFKLRTDRAANKSKIDAIEESWREANTAHDDDAAEAQKGTAVENRDIYPTEIVGRISQSNVVKISIPSDDLISLIDADNKEDRASKFYDQYISNYLRASELHQLYNQTEVESQALAYQQEFDALNGELDSLATSLESLWYKIYDDKIFIYSFMLESLNNNEVLQSGLKVVKKAESNLSLVKSDPSNRVIVDYMYKKPALVEFESLIAERFNLPRAADSLLDVVQKLMVRRSSDEFPQLSITERSFIPYAPIVFSTSIAYNDSIPIPATKHYVKGTVYRVQFGSYKTKQNPELFKGASPISYEVLDGMYTYYGGAYATYVECEEAAAESKRQGFNRPEMVVWQNGVRRNLYRDPIGATKGYNIVVDDAPALASETSSIVDMIGGGAKLVRITANKYVISPLKNIYVAEDVLRAITTLNQEVTFKMTDIE